MKACYSRLILSLIVACATLSERSLAQSTAFTFQGKLQSSGSPVTGTYDLRLTLFAAPTGPAQVGSTICQDNVPVTAGIFTTVLDFGQQYAATTPVYLEVQVRQDTGLTCSSLTGFVTLTPRQQLTGAPGAVQANAAFSLDAPGGAVPNAVYVNAGGNVGVGTTTPAMKLSVAGDMEMGTFSSDYHRFRIGGGNSSGFIYGSYPALGDGIHMGYNFYADSVGTFRTVATDGQTSRISMGYGYVALATGGINAVPVNRLTVSTAGNVGVGTDGPADKLDVRGNIKLGPSGQFYAPAGEENLRIIRGVCTAAGGTIVGSGFSSRHDGPVGFYHITFNTAFSGPPAVTITADGSSGTFAWAMTDGVLADQFELMIRGTGGFVDAPFHFIAVGPR